MTSRKVFMLVANRGYALKSSREGLIRYFLGRGWRVIIATADDEYSRALVGLGAELEPVRFSRGGFAPRLDWWAWRRLIWILRAYEPALVHLFHAKPVILAALAARRELGSATRVVNTITGLGHAFVYGGLTTRIASTGYRLALPRADITVFQNRDDRALFVSRRWVPEAKTRVIVGSGIEVGRFASDARLSSREKFTVIMLGRVIWQKGVGEFASVAKLVRQQAPDVRFVWAGEMDPEHPDAVPQSWLDQQAAFEYVGQVSDVPDRLRQADVMLFPSYREGVPRAVMEAAASGVPVVGFDVPGVREAVRHDETGFLVPDRDIDALTAAVERLLADRALRERMGAAAKRLAESEFDIRSIQSQHLALYRELGVDIPAR